MVEQFRALGCEAQLDRAGNVAAHLNPGYQRPAGRGDGASGYGARAAQRRRNHGHSGRTFHGPAYRTTARDFRRCWPWRRRCGPTHACRRCPLLLVANVGEEGEGNLSGMRYLCKQSPLAARIRSFLVLDGPSTDHITWQALAAAASTSPSPDPAGIAGAITASATPSTRSAGRSRCLRTRDRTARRSRDRRSISASSKAAPASTRSRRWRARRWISGRKARRASTNLRRSLPRASKRRSRWRTSVRPNGKVGGKIKEIGSRPGGQLADDAHILARAAGGGQPSGNSFPPGLRLHGREYSAVHGNAGRFDRSGRAGRRSAHTRRVVPSRRPRVRPAADPARRRFCLRATCARAPTADDAITRARRWKADLALVGVTFIWGATFILVKEALNSGLDDAVPHPAVRIATLALWFAFRGRGSHFPRNRKRELLIGLLVGTCLFSGYVLQTAGLRYTTASKAGFITGILHRPGAGSQCLAVPPLAADLRSGRCGARNHRNGR